MIDENAIRARYAAIRDQLDERGRRLFVAAEKAAAGYGGTAAVSRATGVARSTIIRSTFINSISSSEIEPASQFVSANKP